jgi:DNA-binding PadR family transcriptional regulator
VSSRLDTTDAQGDEGTMPDSRDPAGWLPLTPALFYVLVALADEDKHGYAIIKDVEALTAGRVRLSSGTLYGIVKRLLDDGLVVEARRKAGDDERRRRYRLTPFGRDVALAETARLERAAALARATARLRDPLARNPR